MWLFDRVVLEFNIPGAHVALVFERVMGIFGMARGILVILFHGLRIRLVMREIFEELVIYNPLRVVCLSRVSAQTPLILGDQKHTVMSVAV